MLKKTYIINILLFVIFVVFVFLILNDLNYNQKNNIEIDVNNISFLKYQNYYELSFSVEANKEVKLSDNKYDIYILDKNNNLLYRFNKVSIDSQTNKKEYVNFIIEYDVSDFTDILVVISGEKVSYNKNLSKKLNYIGITTTTSRSTKLPAPKIEDQINISG